LAGFHKSGRPSGREGDTYFESGTGVMIEWPQWSFCFSVHQEVTLPHFEIPECDAGLDHGAAW